MMTIFHISDLHLSENLSDLPITAKIEGFEGHDIKVWLAFKNHILDRIKQTDDNYKICITGDLSRFGSIDSFNLASDLLFSDRASILAKEFGLRIPRERFCIVPGNHDSYNNSIIKKNSLGNFNDVFYGDGNKEYPIIIEQNISKLDLSFIVIDSTHKKNGLTLEKKLGKGKVSFNQLIQLKGYNKSNSSNNKIKILCMHHSPIIVDSNRNRNLMLDKSHEFLKSVVDNNIDIILCGHLHDDFYDVLPLKKFIRNLPQRRGRYRLINRIFQETNLNNYKPISIRGNKIRYFDSVAYYYIRNNSENYGAIKDIDDFKSSNEFIQYLYSLPQYSDFKSEYMLLGQKETALIMCGSTCKAKEKSNSYIELNIDDQMEKIKIIRYKYNSQLEKFDSKERFLSFNKIIK